MKKKSLALILGALSVAAAPLMALAQTAQPATDLSNRTTYPNLTAYGKYKYSVPGSFPTRNVSANACGVIRIASSTSTPIGPSDSISIAGVSTSVASLPVGPAPGCTNGQLSNVANLPAQTTWKDSNGAIYQRGITAFAPVSLQFLSLTAKKSISANACGMLNFPADVFGQTVTIYDASDAVIATLNTASLTPTAATPFCRNGITYVPAGSIVGGGAGS